MQAKTVFFSFQINALHKFQTPFVRFLTSGRVGNCYQIVASDRETGNLFFDWVGGPYVPDDMRDSADIQDPVAWILRAEGVNFGHTVFHTQYLAAIRGASVTLEQGMQEAARWLAAQPVPGTLVYCGASQMVWRLEGIGKSDALDWAERLRQWFSTDHGRDAAPTRFLSIMVDIAGIRPAPGDTDSVAEFHAINRAHLANRYRQMRVAQFPGASPRKLDTVVDTTFKAVCPIDRRRPVGDHERDTIPVPEDSFPDAIRIGDARNERKRILVSPSIAALVRFGRHKRRQFYTEAMPDLGEKLNATDQINSFGELIEAPPVGPSVSARGKMAVLYVDGAGFGALRDRMAQSGPGISKFAELAETLLGGLLQRAVSRFLNDGGDAYLLDTVDDAGKDVRKLRFETLLRAGDEFCVVVPAWTAWEVMGDWFEHTAEFNATHVEDLKGTEGLSLRIGCLICSEKTPVRRARSLAYGLQEEVKAGDCAGGAIVQILESVEAPEPTAGFAEMRERLFGTGNPAHFVIPDSAWTARTDHIVGLKRLLPRSALRKMIQRSVEEAEHAVSTEAIRTMVAASLERSDATGIEVDELLSPMLNHSPAVPANFSLKFLDDLWDYVDPFERKDDA